MKVTIHSQDALAGSKPVARQNADVILMDNAFESYEEVKKDRSALSKEEQMEVVYRYDSIVKSSLLQNFSYACFLYLLERI